MGENRYGHNPILAEISQKTQPSGKKIPEDEKFITAENTPFNLREYIFRISST